MQQTPAGCMYHAAFALTGEEHWLEPWYVEDVSEARFVVRLALADVGLFPFWVTPRSGPTTPEAFWYGLVKNYGDAPPAEEAPLMVSIAGNSPGWLHTVAVGLPLIDGGNVTISDSSLPELLSLPWAQFLLSDYAQAHRVEMLGPLDLIAYPPDHRTP